MELFLNNIGIIKDSKIKLNGLTVITGKNGAGKTTVGKVVYSLINAGSNTVDAFNKARKTYVCSQLMNLQRYMQFRIIRTKINLTKERDPIYKTLQTLTMMHYRKFDMEHLLAFLGELKNTIENLTLEQYKNYILDVAKDGTIFGISDRLINYLSEEFPEWKRRASEICETTLEIAGNENAYLSFVKDRTAAYLNHEFNKQIRPINEKRVSGRIKLEHQEKTIVDAYIRNKDLVDFSAESTFSYPYSNCIFVENPFVIDRLDRLKENSESHRNRMFPSEEYASESIITSNDVEAREDVLIKMLLAEEKGYFNDVEIQAKYKDVFEKINKIVPGEFLKGTNGFFYVNNGSKLAVSNLATGSKTFFIIKKLLANGLLNDETVLILDEPESHLHPEWINKFAEILAILVKDVRINVLLTTHSPNLLAALDFFAKAHAISDKTNFYLAHIEKENASQIKDITNSLNEGYAHLSIPLVEMSIKLKKN